MSIEDLKYLAKLNLCEECYSKYTAMIEPSIKHWWSLEPLIYWREIESCITQIVMKHKGVFKGEIIFISIDEDMDEKFAEKVDVKAFIDIKRWKFIRKINYLKKQGILQNSSYKLLNKVRKIRNVFIHNQFTEIPEKDLDLFSCASTLTNYLWNATMINWSEKQSADLKSIAEKFAEQLLLIYNKRS